MPFTNSAVAFDPSSDRWSNSGSYSYKNISPHMHLWSRRLQRVVSQSASHHFSGKFHDQECGIYKSEGGCKVVGAGDLVLLKDCCRFDRYGGKNEVLESKEKWCAGLISSIVLEWNPNDPIESMLVSAAKYCENFSHNSFSKDDLKAVIEKSSCGGVFGGDSLSSLFDHNPFGKFPTDLNYRRFCLVNFHKKTDVEVDQLFADEKLGDDLLKEMQVATRAQYEKSRQYSPIMMCCSPSRKGKELSFWLNDGVYYGWHTESEVREVVKKLKRGEKLPKPK